MADRKMDKGVVIPPRYGTRYAFIHQMEAGDSCLIHDSEEPSMRAILSRHKRNGGLNGAEFTVRKTSEGYRLWRLK